MYKHLLVPIDESSLSTALVGDAVRFASEIGARITFFHAVSDFLATSDGALFHAMDPQEAARLAAGAAHGVLNKAEAAARAAGVECTTHYTVSNRVPRAIIEIAQARECDLIYTATRGAKSIGSISIGSNTVQLLAQSPIAVLVSSIARTKSEPDADRVISIIQDEHRSLAAVLNAMQRVLGQATPDLSLLKEMMTYIKRFPETLHHPKEEELFAFLRSRTEETNEALDQLQHQHREGRLLQDMENALVACEMGEAGARQRFAAAFDAFTKAQWKHMNLEENVVLPALRRYLTADDWADAAADFSGNNTPRFTNVPNESFNRVFLDVMQKVNPVVQG